YAKKELEENSLWDPSYESTKKEWFRATVDLIRARYLLITDFSSKGRYCFSDVFEFDPKAVKKNLCQDSKLVAYIPEFAQLLDHLQEFNLENVEAVFREFALEKDVKAGLLINAARTAVSGSSVGPGLFEMLVMLGKERVVARLRDSVNLIDKHS
ncbi:MAG: glutamyl-tRNA synthetase, partial [Thermodesulfobacteriota bacterium]|nr:glutamyl-tRNA synthetase [Thermodesulfobacteriota bacterium]